MAGGHATSTCAGTSASPRRIGRRRRRPRGAVRRAAQQRTEPNAGLAPRRCSRPSSRERRGGDLRRLELQRWPGSSTRAAGRSPVSVTVGTATSSRPAHRRAGRPTALPSATGSDRRRALFRRCRNCLPTLHRAFFSCTTRTSDGVGASGWSDVACCLCPDALVPSRLGGPATARRPVAGASAGAAPRPCDTLFKHLEWRNVLRRVPPCCAWAAAACCCACSRSRVEPPAPPAP